MHDLLATECTFDDLSSFPLLSPLLSHLFPSYNILFLFFLLFSFFTDSLHSYLFSFHFLSFYPTLLSLCYSLPFLFLPSFLPFSFSLIPRPLSFVVLRSHTFFSRYSPGFICFPWSIPFVASHELPFSSAISSDFFPSFPQFRFIFTRALVSNPWQPRLHAFHNFLPLLPRLLCSLRYFLRFFAFFANSNVLSPLFCLHIILLLMRLNWKILDRLIYCLHR